MNDKTVATTARGTRMTELEGLMFYEQTLGKAAGFSDRSIESTILALETLQSFLIETGRTTDVSMITIDDIRAFIVHLMTVKRYEKHPYASKQKDGLSPVTVNIYLRASRAAFNRWVNDGIIEKSAFAGLKLPKLPEKIMPIFTEEQIQAMLKAIDTSTPVGFRNSLLVQLYLDTGCRLSEITNARMDDIDWKMKTIRVWGKGKKERLVPFGYTVAKLLWKYVKQYRPEPALPEYDNIFLIWDGHPLSPRRVERIFKRIGERTGIKGVRCSPHTGRHTFCSIFLRNKGDLVSLQRIVGHSTIQTTQKYIHLFPDDICQVHSECSPIDHLGRSKEKRKEMNR